MSGGHQILANLGAFLYMMPQSIGIATAALSAQAIGATKYHLSHSISLQGFLIGFIGALISITLIYFGKSWVIYLYTNDLHVAAMAASLLTIVPVFHLLDYFQCVVTYVLRAHKIATLPFIIQTVLLIGLGLGGGYYFGYGNGKGALDGIASILTPGATTGISSLWIMCCSALFCCGLILAIWYTIITRPLLRQASNQ